MTGNQRPIRVGVVGLGKVAQLHHLPNLAGLPEFELAAVCDLSAGLAHAVARRYGLPATAATTDHRALVARDVDAVVVANRHHAPVVLDALAAGRHVFVEKPLCWNLDEAADIDKAVAASGRVLLVGYMKRYDPAVQRLRDATGGSAMRYARIHNFAGGRHRHERLHPVVKPTDLDPAVLAEENAAIDDAVARMLPDPDRIAAFRTLCELASHDVNLARALLGPAQVESAAVYRVGDESCYLTLLRHGATPLWLECLPDFRSRRDWDEELSVFTTGGAVGVRFTSPFRYDAATVLWERGERGSDEVDQATVVSRISPYRRQLQHFHRCVVSGEAPVTDVADATEDLRLLRDIASSAAFR